MFDLDWHPSTVIDAPLIQLARGEARNATTDADFVGAAEAAERELAFDEVGDDLGLRLLAPMPGPAGKQDRARAPRC